MKPYLIAAAALLAVTARATERANTYFTQPARQTDAPRASVASEARGRSESAERRARPRAGESEGQSPSDKNVEFEMMTWKEVKSALEAGKTTALVYTGGTEQRGPQNVNGGHTLMGREVVRAVALKLGNAIALPVLPYTPNNASATLPGTIGLTNDLLAAILERIADQAIVTGFKNVVLMGDHGGGQPNVYRDTARKLDDKYAPQGIHIYYCDDVYTKRMADFDKYLESKSLPTGGHASIIDTSEMLYLGGDKGWVRKDLIPTALGDPVGRGRGGDAPRVNNGITGDARPSTAELGKYEFDMQVDYAVRQIQQFLTAQKPQG